MFSKNSRVLVVDDMKTMRMMLKKVLKGMGFTNIEEADDGETAWPMIEQAVSSGAPYGIIFSDWNMPGMKGIDLLRKVRADSRVSETPFLLVTAEGEKHQVVEAVKAGVDNYVMKPFTQQTVQEKLDAVVAKKAS